MDYNNISPELREKAKACTSPEELIALAITSVIRARISIPLKPTPNL